MEQTTLLQNVKGVVAGSFDPVTLGHLYVMRKALKVVDELIILVAANKSKKGMFTLKRREQILEEALEEVFCVEDRAKIRIITMDIVFENTSVVAAAKRLGAELYFRGIRNTQDFEYEHQLQLVNQEFAPSVTTMFVMPPAQLTAVSSSMVKSIVGLTGWQKVAKKYVPTCVVNALGAEHILSKKSLT